jgi:uncharacterized protein YyaL (SSP411 family)
MSNKCNPVGLIVGLLLLCGSAEGAGPTSKPGSEYEAKAAEVTAYLQRTFWDEGRGVYVKTTKDRTPDYVWREAAAFSVLTAAARHDPRTYRPLLARFFKALDAYWDTKTAIPAYEPAPTKGNGHDKYYDDNAWLVITFLEAYELTGERAYFVRAREVAKFVASGWDDEAGGGIWWHQSHKDGSKNTCANGPAAVGYLRLAQLGPKQEAEAWATAARGAVEWTQQKLQAKDGLYDDRIIVATGEVKRGKLTYNSALMLRAELGLYRATGKAEYLDEAKRIGKAAEAFADKNTGVYRDPLKWSQFMVEADLELYRATGEEYLLRRAKTNADAYYAAWKDHPTDEMMAVAGTARVLWLLAETEAAGVAKP